MSLNILLYFFEIRIKNENEKKQYEKNTRNNELSLHNDRSFFVRNNYRLNFDSEKEDASQLANISSK